jgi:hypothetical protein
MIDSSPWRKSGLPVSTGAGQNYLYNLAVPSAPILRGGDRKMRTPAPPSGQMQFRTNAEF